MTSQPLDPAAIMAEHESDDAEMEYSECVSCYRVWPCLPHRLAARLQRIAQLADDAARTGSTIWPGAIDRILKETPDA